jgi:effector-binding domain-containing protein
MDIAIVETETRPVAVVRKRVPMAELAGFFGEAFATVVTAVAGAGGTITGPPFGWYHGMPAADIDVTAGFPVAGLATGPLGDGAAAVEEQPGGRAVVCIHVGPYDTLADSYARMQEWMAARDLRGRHDMWEEYLSDPETHPDPATWQTRLVIPLA